MILKDKMFVVSSDLDESIKLQVPSYDVRLFSNFLDLESAVEGTPIIIHSLVLTSTELPFNNTNMIRLTTMTCSPFLQIKGSVLYIVDKTYNKQMIETFFKQAGVDNIIVYQGNIDNKYITDILTGEARDAEEQKQYQVIYRMRTDEYIKQQKQLKYMTGDTHYQSDDEEMGEIPDEEVPEDSITEIVSYGRLHYIAGVRGEERTLMLFLLAQYMSISGKTLIIEHDEEYHLLTEMYTKSGLEGLFIEMDEVFTDFKGVLAKIKLTSCKLILIGCINRIKYNYAYIITLLISNLKEHLQDIIFECDCKEVPYGVNTIYVTATTVPAILEMTSNISQDIVPANTMFIGLQLNEISININKHEMTSIIEGVLEKNNIQTEIFYADSIVLSGEVPYDLRSIII